MSNPELVLLDEVSLGLAPVVVRALYEALPRIAEGGTTVVVVEQDITLALDVADRVYCLLEGRVSLVGAADRPHPRRHHHRVLRGLTMQWVNAAIQGILVGGLYALFATGLSLAFGVMRFVNLAHGDLAILAAYLVLSVSAVFGIGYWASLVLVIAIMAVVGYVGQRGAVQLHARGGPAARHPRQLRRGHRDPERAAAALHGHRPDDRPRLHPHEVDHHQRRHLDRLVPAAHPDRRRRGPRWRCSCSSPARRSAAPSAPRPTTRRPRS